MFGTSRPHSDRAEEAINSKFWGASAERAKSLEPNRLVTLDWPSHGEGFVAGTLSTLDLVSTALKTAYDLICADNGCGGFGPLPVLAPSGVRSFATVAQAAESALLPIKLASANVPERFLLASRTIHVADLPIETKEAVAASMFSDTAPHAGLIPPREVRSAFIILCRQLTAASEFERSVPPGPLRENVQVKFESTYPAAADYLPKG